MSRPRRSYLGAWVLAFTIVFRILMLMYTYSHYRRLYSHLDDVPDLLSFVSLFEKIFLCVLFIEMLVYIFIRNRIFKIQWVRLHVWPLLIATVILPMIAILLFFWGARRASAQGYSDYMKTVLSIRLYLFWGLVGIAHAFFIATIAKCFSAKKERIDENPPGLLDEFVD